LGCRRLRLCHYAASAYGFLVLFPERSKFRTAELPGFLFYFSQVTFYYLTFSHLDPITNPTPLPNATLTTGATLTIGTNSAVIFLEGK
jgi:hypothetical protein